MTYVACETIVAEATPPGQGGISIVRLSGAKVLDIALVLLMGKSLVPRFAHYATFKDDDGSVIDQGLAIYFPKPYSFTGEDVLELHVHGSPLVVDCLIARVIKLGAVLAQPGEFSKRAFLNGKIDLLQAEAIADLISASTDQARRLAQRSLQGEFSVHINQLTDKLSQLRVYIEATIDFPDEEDVDFLTDGKVMERLEALKKKFVDLQKLASFGCLVNEGITAVLAGVPNVGKSSLFNYLSQQDAAIVTPIAGTTRDVLRQNIHIAGVPLHLIDTAGLHQSSNVIEKEGMVRAKKALVDADIILYLVDISKGETVDLKPIVDLQLKNTPIIIIYNKIDLVNLEASLDNHSLQVDDHLVRGRVYLSAKYGQGIDLLVQHLLAVVNQGQSHEGEGEFIARRRHLEALAQASHYLDNAIQELFKTQALELIAENLFQAQKILGGINGEVSSDALLGKIFTTFCIGK